MILLILMLLLISGLNVLHLLAKLKHPVMAPNVWKQKRFVGC